MSWGKLALGTFLLCFLSLPTSAFVHYEPCSEYIFNYKAKSSLEQQSSITWKAQFGIEFLNKTKGTEGLLRIYQAKQQYGNGGQEVSLLDKYKFGGWFSFTLKPDGEIDKVYYPSKDEFDVIVVKKTLVAYVSSRFNQLHEPQSYTVMETGLAGLHKAHYTRSVNRNTAVYTKKEDPKYHPAQKYSEILSEKKIHIDREMRIPRVIEMTQRVTPFAKSKKRFNRQKLSPGAKITIDKESKNTKFPSFTLSGHGVMEFIRKEKRQCDIFRPLRLRTDSLTVPLNEQTTKNLWKVEYAKDTERIYDCINGNLTCIHQELKSKDPPKGECFQMLLRTLSGIPDEHLPDVMDYYFKNSSHHANDIHYHRLIMIDAMIALRNPVALENIYKYIFSPTSQTNEEFQLRTISQIGLLSEVPDSKIVLAIKRLAFHPLANISKELRRSATLIYGSLIRLHLRSEDKMLRVRGHTMLSMLEAKVGMHDPYHWKESSDDNPYVKEKEVDHVVLLEALGNVGHSRSFHHIVSHINHTKTPLAFKRAGLHALRHIHTDQAAEALLESALFDEEEHTRYTAHGLYMEHPLKQDIRAIYDDLKRGFENHTYPRCPKPISDEHHQQLLHHHRIVRRSVLTKVFFKRIFRTPTLNYVWSVGNHKLGAAAGLKIRNELELEIALTRGHVRVYVDNHAFCKAHVGLINFEFTFLDAKICYVAVFEYNINILQEMGLEDVAKAVRYWDRIQNGVVKRLKDALSQFNQFLTGVKNIFSIIGKLETLIDDIVHLFTTNGRVIKKSLQELAMLEELPAIRPLVSAYRKIIELVATIRSDVMDAFNSVVDVVKVQLPLSWQQIHEALISLGRNIVKLFKSPNQAVQAISKSVFKIKVGIEGLTGGWTRIKKALFLDGGEKPSWWNLKETTTELKDDLSKAWNSFQSKASLGHLKVKEQREKVFGVLKGIYQKLSPLLETIDFKSNLLARLNDFKNIFTHVKATWENLKLAYDETRSIIDSVFGPKADSKFPNVIRSAGGGCGDSGYPSPRYSYPGIELEAKAGSTIPSPFSGYLTRLSRNRLLIEPDGSAFDDIKIYVSNVEVPSEVVSGSERRKIYSGDLLGTVLSTDCVNHIHVAMKSDSGFIDPSRYLSNKDVKFPGFRIICQEHRFVVMKQTQTYGPLMSNPVEKDTSPSRSTSEIPPVYVPGITKGARKKRSTAVVKDGAEKFADKVKKMKSDFTKAFKAILGIPEDSTFSDFFKRFSLTKMKFSTIIGLLDKLKLQESKKKIIALLKRYIDLASNKKCVRPEEMLDDELRVFLEQRGYSASGSRSDLRAAYYQSLTKCIFWMNSLPDKSSCTVDKKCLGIECCFDYKFGVFYKAFRGYARLDPCTLKLKFGVDVHPYNWSKVVDLKIHSKLAGKHENIVVSKVDLIIGTFQMKVGYEFARDEEKLFLSVWIALCESENKCFANLYFLEDLLLPIPHCLPDGTVVLPSVNLTDIFNRKAILKQMKMAAKQKLESTVQSAVEIVAKKLLLPVSFLKSDEGHQCSTPSRMTLTELSSLANMTVKRVNRTVLENIVKEKTRKCTWFSLPKIPSVHEKYIYCNISRNCLRIQCCLNIPVPLPPKKSIPLSAIAQYDPCKFTMTFQFHSVKKVISLIDYRWGEERLWRIGPVSFKYMVGRTSDQKFFVLKMAIKLCFEGHSCLIDQSILNQNRIPVPVCNEKFLQCFQGENSIRTLIDKKRRPVTKFVKDRVIKCLGLNNLFLNNLAITVPSSFELPSCKGFNDSWAKRTCSAGHQCWQMSCRFSLNLLITEVDVKASFSFDPCSYNVNLSIGNWNKSFNLMQHVLGVQHELTVSDVLRIFFKFGEGKEKTTFKVDLYYKVCFAGACTANQYLLKNIEIGKPICHPNFTKTLPGGSVPAFLAILGVDTAKTAAKSVSRLAVDRVLEFLGIKQCLSTSSCVRTDDTHISGWDNQCKRISSLPKLPSDVRCSIGASCSSIRCCLDADITIWQGSLTMDIKFNPCEQQLILTFEKCTRKIHLKELGRKYEIKLHEKLSFSFMVEKGTDRQLRLSGTAYICLKKCERKEILDKSIFNCDEKKSRRKRSAKIRASPPANRNGQSGQRTGYSSLMNQQGQSRHRPIRLRKLSILHILFGTDNTPACDGRCIFSSSRMAPRFLPEPGPDMELDVAATLDGKSIFDFRRGNKGSLFYMIGEGLTEAGKAALGDRLANMTIADLSTILEGKSVDPYKVLELMRQLREAFFTVTAETLKVLFDGGFKDLFKTFDVTMRARISFPSKFLTILNPRISFFIPPVPCLFSTGLHLSGFFGLNIQGELRLMNKLGRTNLDPYAGLMARAYGGMNCFIFKGEVSLNAYILRTHFPISVEIGYTKFPMKIRYCVSLISWPLRVELVVKFYIRVLFFMKKRKKRWVFRSIVRFVRRIFRIVVKWKLLFHKVLWAWSMPPLRKLCFLGSKDEETNSDPPQISNGKCLVHQLRGQPPQTPKVEIKADIVDDKSVVHSLYSIGTAHGVENLVKDKPYKGPSAIIDVGSFRQHPQLFFKLTSANDEGYKAYFFCDTRLDVTAPHITVNTHYKLTSDPSRLGATAEIIEESTISSAFVSVSTGPGNVGDQTAPWRALAYHQVLPSTDRGKRYAANIQFSGLSLLHSQLYFINVRVNDSFGYTTIRSSEPVMVDLTPPKSANESGVQQTLLRDKCSAFTLKKWLPFCNEHLRTKNHKIIHDNEHSKLFWNGQDRIKELKWSRINQFVSACFKSFTDDESHIRGYSVCLGKEFCRCDFLPLFDPHEGLKLASDWDYCAHAMRPGHRAFPEGRYYWRLTVINKSPHGGHLASTLCHRRPYVIDTSPPHVLSADKLRIDLQTRLFSLHLRCEDVQSGLYSVKIGFGKSRFDVSVMPFKLMKEWKKEIQIFDGLLSTRVDFQLAGKFYIHLLVENNVELTVQHSPIRPLTIDTTPPTRGVAYAGRKIGSNEQYFGKPDQLCVSWTGFNDPESGIALYTVHIGTCPGCSDVYIIEDIKPSQQVACLPSSQASRLTDRGTYYSTVIAVNGGHDGLKSNATSSKMIFDETPPIMGRVFDGFLPTNKDENFSSRQSLYTVHWTSATDSISSIKGYNVSVFRHTSSGTSTLADKQSLQSTAQRFTLPGLHLAHKDKLWADVIAVNGGGLSTRAQTDGLLIDLTSPLVRSLKDVSSGSRDGYQSSTKALNVQVDAADPESGLTYAKCQLFELKNGKQHMTDVTVTRNLAENVFAGTVAYNAGKTLQTGLKYGCRLTIGNGAGMTTVKDSDGILVDATPPVISDLTIGSGVDSTAYINNGYAWLSQSEEIILRVRAVDPESQIHSFLVSVGTTRGGSDIVASQRHPGNEILVVKDIKLEVSKQVGGLLPNPTYHVTVIAENFAGSRSQPVHSPKIAVVAGDKAGVVLDGPGPNDADVQIDSGLVVATFKGFSSALHGIRYFEVGVGIEPGQDDIVTFSKNGIVNVDDNFTQGQVHVLAELKMNVEYFVTIRAVTNGNKILAASSDGFKVRQMPLKTKARILSQQPNSNGVVYIQRDTKLDYEVTPSKDEDGSIVIHRQRATAPLLHQSTPPAAQPGIPIYTTIEASDSLGLRKVVDTVPVTVDPTPPKLDSLDCDKWIKSVESTITCRLTGLADFESPITQIQIRLIKERATTSPSVVEMKFDGPVPKATFFLTPLDRQRLGNTFFGRAIITNGAGWVTDRFSSPISRPEKAQNNVLVINVGDFQTITWNNKPEPTRRRRSVDKSKQECASGPACKAGVQKCQTALDKLSVAWNSFGMKSSDIQKILVGLGSTKGSADIKKFTEVGVHQQSVTFRDLNLQGVSKIYSTVRLVTKFGTEVSTSDPIYINKEAASLYQRPFNPIRIASEDKNTATTSLMLSVELDFTGEPCPMKKVEWSVEKIGGEVIRPYSNTDGATKLTYLGLDLMDGETIFVKIRTADSLNLVHIFRSKPIVIRKQAIEGGHVFDGSIIGHDLAMQLDMKTLAVNWNGFKIPGNDISYSGNTDERNKPQIDYYEVAIGTKDALDNVAAFKTVGLKTATTFNNLDLLPNVLYFATVRAHGRWFKSAQKRSDGILVGVNAIVKGRPLEITWFPKEPNSVGVKWSAFETPVDMKMYLIGLRKTETSSEKLCTEIMQMIGNEKELETYYDTTVPSNVNTELSASITARSLKHGQKYTVEVIGVNVAGKCALSRGHFIADFTPPVRGQIVLYDLKSLKKIYFTRKRNTLRGKVHGFTDAETEIESCEVSLMESESRPCLPKNWRVTKLKNGKDASFVTGAKFTEFFFENIELQPNIFYMIRATAVNKVKLSTSVESDKILLEDAAISVGKVKPGEKHDGKERLFMSLEDGIPYTFLHGMSGATDTVKVPTDKSAWDVIQTSGVIFESSYPWTVYHRPPLVKFTASDFALSLRPVLGASAVEAGAVNCKTSFYADATYNFKMRSAPGSYAVTAFVLWGANSSPTPIIKPSVAEKDDIDCRCCLAEAKLVRCSCDCPKYLDTLKREKEEEEKKKRRETEVDKTAWKISSSPSTKTPEAKADACGLQVYKLKGQHYAQAWCYTNKSKKMKSRVVALAFDPSADFHTYHIAFEQTVVDDWIMRVLIDDRESVEIAGGFSKLPEHVRAIFHTFNHWESLPTTKSETDVYSTTAYFGDMSFPPASMALARFGKPFLISTPTLATYEARLIEMITNSTEETRIIYDWTNIYEPCIPCFDRSPCSAFFCASECKKLQQFKGSFAPKNDDSILSALVQIRLSTIGGHVAVATSNPIVLDSTPPVQEKEIPLTYHDTNSKDPYKPVSVQGSDTTISIQYTIADPESGILGFWVGIGTKPNSQDVLGFTSFGTKTWINITNLVLKNNVTYYATLRAINNAMQGATFVDDVGIRVLSELPSVKGMKAGNSESSSFKNGVRAANTKMSKNNDKISVDWTKPKDPSIQKAEYCVGSSPQKRDDIVKCMMFEKSPDEKESKAGGVEIEGGVVKSKAGASANVGDIQREKTATKRKGTHLEPGRTLYSHLSMCNAAEKCKEVPCSKVQLVPPGARVVTSDDRSSSTLESGSSKGERRMRRSTDGEYIRYEVHMSKGEPSGTSLVIGNVNDTHFAADTSSSYKPYIVDPVDTGNRVSRLLTNRIKRFISNGIFVATVGQVELKGPLQINVTLKDVAISDDSIAQLLYWNTEYSAWRPAEYTCLSRQNQSSIGAWFLTDICRTQDGAANVTSNPTATQQYFQFETQFVAAIVRKDFPNAAPVIDKQSPVTLNGTESPLRAEKNLRATDPEGDGIKWFLMKPLPALGTATINETTGELTYQPHIGAVGTDEIRVMARDVPSISLIPPKSSNVTISVHLICNKNRPIVLPYKNNKEVQVVLTEEVLHANVSLNARNIKTLECQEPSILDIVAFDHDTNDDIKFKVIESATSKGFKLTDRTSIESIDHIFNFLPNPPSQFATKQKVSVIYPSLPGNYHLKIVGEDSRQYFSLPVEISITISENASCAITTTKNGTEITSKPVDVGMTVGAVLGSVVGVGLITGLIICLIKRFCSSKYTSTKVGDSSAALRRASEVSSEGSRRPSIVGIDNPQPLLVMPATEIDQVDFSARRQSTDLLTVYNRAIQESAQNETSV